MSLREINSVPTVHNGIRFRSRTEARWAAFMDELGIAYEYEPGRYPLSIGGFYVPDFRIKAFDAWLEVKPANDCIRKLERHKAEQFCADNPGPRYWISNGYPRAVADYIEEISDFPENWGRRRILEDKTQQGRFVVAAAESDAAAETARIRRAFLAANAAGGFGS